MLLKLRTFFASGSMQVSMFDPKIEQVLRKRTLILLFTDLVSIAREQFIELPCCRDLIVWAFKRVINCMNFAWYLYLALFSCWFSIFIKFVLVVEKLWWFWIKEFREAFNSFTTFRKLGIPCSTILLHFTWLLIICSNFNKIR